RDEGEKVAEGGQAAELRDRRLALLRFDRLRGEGDQPLEQHPVPGSTPVRGWLKNRHKRRLAVDANGCAEQHQAADICQPEARKVGQELGCGELLGNGSTE